MKKGFMRKKAVDMTVSETIEFIGILMTILTLVTIPMCWAILKADEIIDAFETISTKIRTLLCKWVDSKEEEP